MTLSPNQGNGLSRVRVRTTTSPTSQRFFKKPLRPSPPEPIVVSLLKLAKRDPGSVLRVVERRFSPQVLQRLELLDSKLADRYYGPAFDAELNVTVASGSGGTESMGASCYVAGPDAKGVVSALLSPLFLPGNSSESFLGFSVLVGLH